MLGLIRVKEQLQYREEVKRLVDWCHLNNLDLNVDNTSEIIVDFRRKQLTHTRLYIDDWLQLQLL